MKRYTNQLTVKMLEAVEKTNTTILRPQRIIQYDLPSWCGVTHDDHSDKVSLLLPIPRVPMPDLSEEDPEHEQVEDIAEWSISLVMLQR